MSIKKVLSQLEGRDWERVRLILLTHNFAFNIDVASIKKAEPKSREVLITRLVEIYKIPEPFTRAYVQSKKLLITDIEADQSIYYVHDKADGGRQIIDQDGIYIKFDPTKPDPYYKKLIKQLRAYYAFNDASDKEQREFVYTKRQTALHFLDNKKAKTPHKPHGYNFEQDIKVYLICEKTIKDMFTSDTTVIEAAKEDNIKRGDAEKYISDALDLTAEKLKLSPQQAKRIYYEVCRRFKLPTLNKNPFPGTYLRTEF